jgi:hypothetical protein
MAIASASAAISNRPIHFLLEKRCGPTPERLAAYLLLLMLANRQQSPATAREEEAATCTEDDEEDTCKHIWDLTADVLLCIADVVIPHDMREYIWCPVGGLTHGWDQRLGKAAMTGLFRPARQRSWPGVGRLKCVRDGLPDDTSLSAAEIEGATWYATAESMSCSAPLPLLFLSLFLSFSFSLTFASISGTTAASMSCLPRIGTRPPPPPSGYVQPWDPVPSNTLQIQIQIQIQIRAPDAVPRRSRPARSHRNS